MKRTAVAVVFGVWAVVAGACSDTSNNDPTGAGGSGGGAPGGRDGGAPGGSGGGAPGGGTGNAPAGDPAVDGSKRIDSLTASEKAALCDWGASLYGGYGREVTCADGSTSSSSDSREVCVNDPVPQCPITVAEFVPCARKVHDLCVAALATAECAGLLACLN
jgi:hypothetical protein